MPRDHLLYLEDMQESAAKVKRYTEGMSFEAFATNSMAVDAVLRNLEIIGEAAKNVPDEVRARYPQVEWRRMAGFRDVAAHYYFGVKLETIWTIIEGKIPLLLAQLAEILEAERL